MKRIIISGIDDETEKPPIGNEFISAIPQEKAPSVLSVPATSKMPLTPKSFSPEVFNPKEKRKISKTKQSHNPIIDELINEYDSITGNDEQSKMRRADIRQRLLDTPIEDPLKEDDQYYTRRGTTVGQYLGSNVKGKYNRSSSQEHKDLVTEEALPGTVLEKINKLFGRKDRGLPKIRDYLGYIPYLAMPPVPREQQQSNLMQTQRALLKYLVDWPGTTEFPGLDQAEKDSIKNPKHVEPPSGKKWGEIGEDGQPVPGTDHKSFVAAAWKKFKEDNYKYIEEDENGNRTPKDHDINNVISIYNKTLESLKLTDPSYYPVNRTRFIPTKEKIETQKQEIKKFINKIITSYDSSYYNHASSVQMPREWHELLNEYNIPLDENYDPTDLTDENFSDSRKRSSILEKYNKLVKFLNTHSKKSAKTKFQEFKNIEEKEDVKFTNLLYKKLGLAYDAIMDSGDEKIKEYFNKHPELRTTVSDGGYITQEVINPRSQNIGEHQIENFLKDRNYRATGIKLKSDPNLGGGGKVDSDADHALKTDKQSSEPAVLEQTPPLSGYSSGGDDDYEDIEQEEISDDVRKLKGFPQDIYLKDEETTILNKYLHPNVFYANISKIFRDAFKGDEKMLDLSKLIINAQNHDVSLEKSVFFSKYFTKELNKNAAFEKLKTNWFKDIVYYIFYDYDGPRLATVSQNKKVATNESLMTRLADFIFNTKTILGK